MRHALTVASAVAVVMLAWAPQAGAQPRARSSARRVPTLRDLPPVGALTARSPDLAAAWQLTDRALRLRAPRAPGQSLAAMNRWTRERFGPWLRRKTDATRAAADALARLAGAGGEPAVVAAALVGLLHEDLGGAVGRVAPPAVIADDIRVFDAFMDALEAQAQSLLERARDAYERCARAQGPAGTTGDAYRGACTTRLEVVNGALAEMVERAQARDRAVAAAPPRARTETAEPAPAGAGVLGVLRAEPAR